MWVSRLRINGGFLNGLDVSFIKGLNVVVGPRGAGKTTLLELIRHAIGAEHADRQRETARQALLAAVLGSGEAIVDLEDANGGSQIIVDAKGRGRRPELSHSVLVLGQSELEDIASDPASRLRLLDLRAGDAQSVPDRSRIANLTRRLFESRRVLEDLREESLKRPGLEADREIFKSQEAAIVGESGSPLASQRDQLNAVEEKSSALARKLDGLTRAREANAKLHETVALASEIATRLAMLARDSIGAAGDLSSHIARVEELLSMATGESGRIDREIRIQTDTSVAAESGLKETAAPLRATLEETEAGLGQLTAQIRNVNAQLLELDAVDAQISVLEQELQTMRAERDFEYATVEAAEERLFRARLAVAKVTSQEIDNHIVVSVQHLSDTRELRTLLLERLKGTHTRSSLIDSLAARVLPRFLLEIVEAQDVLALASAGDLTHDQAARVIGALDSPDALASLSQVALLDSVDFLLRDGAVDKSVETLSTGQKCAVTLPIVLSERDRTLILDQPEDHLDNAYLVDHVVTGMVRRSASAVQTIVATHNANIPVLGSAGRVFVMASDGQHGHVRADGKFDEQPIVDAITSLMEGGRDAFARRSAFYEEHGSLL
ncbi:AAA family ATPase [Microcella flavibacter]|uniref:AAA family ATPase n=1 Tax=Microcella flavibacter TaxID=1804990 RepID=UPI001456B5A2|nr:AAA family ATPase [Microcella flavibacter]